jgi:Fe-S-cluster containining protein
MPGFVCTACGLCCHKKNLDNFNLKHWGLTIGKDGYCTKFKDGMCSIYEDRPFICRVEAAFDNPERLKDTDPAYYQHIMDFKRLVPPPKNTKLEYFKALNHLGCNELIADSALGDEFLIDIETDYDKGDT